jgi:serine/threonine protein kinase
MATVYKGVSYLDGTTVAIKVFHHTDPYLQAKFEQEGRVGQTLHHPHIARILDFGSKDGTLYIIMEYVDNGSLRDRLRPGQPLPLDFVTPVIGQTCEALNYAHNRGVIHRDIKPENIMFSSKEGVKIVDFGIAKVTTSITRTSEGMIVGTPYYMSYEQARGLRVDPRSDIYSLGVVLYEMVTGRVPFAGEPLDVVHKHITERPIPPRRINAALPVQVEAVVMRALEKDRNRRFQTAEEMARALGYIRFMPYLEPYYEKREARPPEVEHERAAVLAQLVVIRGGAKGRRVSLTSPVTILRRRDIDPQDLLISREHARIINQEGYFWLEDLNSTNGTYLNGQRIFEPVLLRTGDHIQIGNSVMKFEG